jgi:hypothetical protein
MYFYHKDVKERRGDLLWLRARYLEQQREITHIRSRLLSRKEIVSDVMELINPAGDIAVQKAWDDGWRPRGYWRTRKRDRRRRRKRSWFESKKKTGPSTDPVKTEK